MISTTSFSTARYAIALLLLISLCSSVVIAQDNTPKPAADTSSTSTSSTTVERVTTVRETTTTEAVQETITPNPVAAIFIKNRANEIYDEKVPALADLVSARVTDLGLSVIDREDAINAVSAFASEGANAGDEDLPGADLDALMSNQASATRLAQMLGADFVLTVSIVSANGNTKQFEGYGTKRTIYEAVMRASYKILDRTRGASITGGTVKATVKQPYQDGSADDGHVYMENTGVLDELLDQVAEQIAAKMQEKIVKVQAAAPSDSGLVNWTIICGATEMVVPTVLETEEGDFVIGEQPLPLNPMNVTVELNGAVVGTAPATLQVPPGLSKLRLTREGYKDFERVVNIAADQTLRIDLQMTDAEYARWKDMTAFLQNLKEGAKLTDAQEEQMRGYAQMLRQSGYMVNYKSDVKVDTTEGVQLHNYHHAPYFWNVPPAAPVPAATPATTAPSQGNNP